MKSNFRITYKATPHQDHYTARIISARTVQEATEKLRQLEGTFIHTTRSITVQCAGVTKSGDPCQRFTHDEYCCEAHRLNDWRKPEGRS